MGYQWTNYITVDEDMSPQKREQVIGVLNWLEDHSPNFMEILWDFEQRKNADGYAKLEDKVFITEDEYGTWYTQQANPKNAKDTLSISFGYDFYLAQDGRLHEFSLNELLLHELGHGSQMLYERFITDEDANRARFSQSGRALRSYLADLGVPEESENSRIPTINDYFVVFDNLETDKKDFDPKILEDSQYQDLLKAHVDNRRVIDAHSHLIEDNTMDRVDELRATIGKPERGHYSHSAFLSPDEISYSDRKSMSVVIYTDIPEILRTKGHPSWAGPENIELGPADTGEITPHFQTVTQTTTQVNNTWNQQYNTDRINITPEEWLFISQARKDFFEGRKISDLTTADRTAYDNLVEELMAGFNQSINNDALNLDIEQKGLSQGLTELSSQAGWKWPNN